MIEDEPHPIVVAYHLPPTGFLREDAVLKLIPWSKSTLWARVKAGLFPAPVSLGPRVTGWRVQSVITYIENPEGWEGRSE